MAVPAVFRKYNEISLIKRILVGLAVGIVLALLIPNVQPWTDIITLLGSLFVGALKAVAPVLVFFLVISALCNAQGAGTMKTVVVLYVISTLVAAIVALIGSEIFPTSLTLDTSSMVEQAACRQPQKCGRGGIGRRARFRFWWATPVKVQVLSPAPFPARVPFGSCGRDASCQRRAKTKENYLGSPRSI